MLKYDQLSTGQRCFLSVIFKLAILMQQNKSGLIILDDGLNDIDWVNFKNLVNIIKTLPFQAILIYQGLQEPIEDTNHILIIREKGESKIHVKSRKRRKQQKKQMEQSTEHCKIGGVVDALVYQIK